MANGRDLQAASLLPGDPAIGLEDVVEGLGAVGLAGPDRASARQLNICLAEHGPRVDIFRIDHPAREGIRRGVCSSTGSPIQFGNRCGTAGPSHRQDAMALAFGTEGARVLRQCRPVRDVLQKPPAARGRTTSHGTTPPPATTKNSRSSGRSSDRARVCQRNGCFYVRQLVRVATING